MSEKIALNQNEEHPTLNGWDILESGLIVPDETSSQWKDLGGDTPLRIANKHGDFRSYEERMNDIENEHLERVADQMSPLSEGEVVKVLDSIGDDGDSEKPESSKYRGLAVYRIKDFLENGTYINKKRQESSLDEFLQNELNYIAESDGVTYRKKYFESAADDNDWIEVDGMGYHGGNDMSIVFAYAMMRELRENPQAARVYSLNEEPLYLDGEGPEDENAYSSRLRGSKAFIRRVNTGEDGEFHYEARLSADGKDLED